MRQDVFLESADGSVVAFDFGVLARGGLRCIRGDLAALGDPLVAAAVEQADVAVAEKGKDPQRVGGPPVGLVTVNNNGAVAGDALGRGEGGESGTIDIVAGDFVIQVCVPVNLDCTRDVSGFVQQDVFIGLHDYQFAVGNGAVGKCCRKPLCGHEAFGVRVGGELFVLFNGVGHLMAFH